MAKVEMGTFYDDEDYAENVRKQANDIRVGYSEGYTNFNWLGLICEDHDEGECLTCDAYRLLQRQEDERFKPTAFVEAMMRRY